MTGRALPIWAKSYTVGPHTYMRTRAGSIGAKARFSRVSVSYSFTSTGISPTCWPGVLLVSNFEKRRPQPARVLANNLPANAADDEKAVHGGRYASGGPFRKVFPGASLLPPIWAAMILPRDRPGTSRSGRISARLPVESAHHSRKSSEPSPAFSD